MWINISSKWTEMDPSRRQRTQTKATAEEQALDQIAREVSAFN